jgi:O-antigen/teichoic acid export membrane protein
MDGRAETIQRRFLYFIAPSLVQAVLPFLVLPLTTLILSPEHYGVLGLATGITATTGALASLGAGLILAQRFPTLDDGGRRRLVTTVGAVVLLLSLILALGLLAAYGLAVGRVDLVDTLPPAGVPLVLVDLIGSNLWGVATTLCTLNRNARPYAIVVSLRTLVTSAAVLAALYGAGLHNSLALFVGQGAGGAVFLLGGLATLRPYLGRSLDGAVARDMIRVGGWMGLSNLAEIAQRMVERWLLAGAGGLALTGLFTHAQTYGTMVMTGIRPAVQAAFPAMLEEARRDRPTFPKTRILARLIAVVMTVAALDMAVIGRDVIGLLTHGKFSPAAPYAALLIAVAMVKLGARGEHCILITGGRSRSLAAANALGATVALGLLALLIPPWGVYGAVVALMAHGLLLITGLRVLARRLKPLPFLDLPALAGAVATVAAVAAMEAAPPSLEIRLGMASILSLGGGTAALVLLRQGLAGGTPGGGKPAPPEP